MEFKGKVAVITGGASGIGRSVALALARLGTDIVVANIDDVQLGEVRQEIESMGRRALAIHCDVSKDADIDNLAEKLVIMSFLGEAATITPPIGLSAFVVASVARTKPEEVFRGVISFFLIALALLWVIVFFPQLATWLPNLFYGAPAS
jgi:NAD(P)-dependent dehydrogenase (short-subunit alcohol dehydrogenase family)